LDQAVGIHRIICTPIGEISTLSL